jgi:hypothetical protein
MDDRTPAEGEASTKALAASQSLRQCKTFPSTRRILCICACVCMCMCVCVCVCVCVCRAARAIGAQRAAGETSAVPKLCTAAARLSAAYNFSNRCTIHDLSATYHSSHNRIHHTNHDLSATYHSSHNRIHHTNHDHTAVLKQQGTCATQRTARHRTLRRPDGRWWTPRRDRWGRCQRTRGSRGCRRLS